LREERFFGFRLMRAKLRDRGGEQIFEERLAVRPRLAGPIEHLVVRGVEEIT